MQHLVQAFHLGSVWCIQVPQGIRLIELSQGQSQSLDQNAWIKTRETTNLDNDVTFLTVDALAKTDLGEHSQQQVPQLRGDLGVLWEAQGLVLHHLE